MIKCMSGKQIIPCGQDLFKEVREENLYYVDKTRFIEQLINQNCKVSIISRPRSFGKTLNMSMLKSFFEIGSDPTLFDGLYITGNQQLCNNYMGKYPVIFLTFCCGFGMKFDDAVYGLKYRIGNAARNCDFLNDSMSLSSDDKKRYREISEYSIGGHAMNNDILVSSLQTLSELLYKHFERKVIILIDAYDVPLYEASKEGYYDEMRDLISDLYAHTLEWNNYLEFAVLTGSRQISKDCASFSFNSFSIDDTVFDDSFGYTQEEVKKILKEYDMDDHFSVIKDWYEGYCFGNQMMFCPWDINNYVSDHRYVPDLEPKDYWLDISSNRIVKDFVYRADLTTKKDLEMLMEGNPVTKNIRSDLTYKEMNESIENIWSVLYTTGYLTSTNNTVDGVFTLAIPNKEVRQEYALQIENWFKYKLLPENKIITAIISEGFLKGEIEKIEKGLAEILGQSICILPANAEKNKIEDCYRKFLTEILLCYPEWVVISQIESCDGFADIFIKPEDYNAGIVIEIKYATGINDMDSACLRALTQIKEKRYDTVLREDGRDRILAYGIAFYKKRCKVKTVKM